MPINPQIKAKNLLLTRVAAQILALPSNQWNYATWASINLPFPVANSTYGLSQDEYNYLFVPDVADLGPNNQFTLGIGPTLTTSSQKEIADRINKFVSNVSAAG